MTRTAGSTPPTLSDIARTIDAQGREIKALSRNHMAPADARVRVRSTIEKVVAIKARALAAARESAEQQARLTRRGRGDVLLDDRVRRANAAIDTAERRELLELRQRNRELERKAARPAGPSGALSGHPGMNIKRLARAAALNYFRTGDTNYKGRSLREYENLIMKASTRGSNPDGGFLVLPEHDVGPIEKMLKERVPMRAHATVKMVGAYELRKPVRVGGGGAAWGTELAGASNTATPTYDMLSFLNYDLYAEPRVAQDLLDDATWDIEAEIADQSIDDFADAESLAWITGDGNGKPRGILGYASGDYVANSSWAWPKIGFITSGSASALTADSVRRLPLEMKAGYRQNAKWMMQRQTIGAVRLLKDTTGQYLWANGDLSKGIPNLLDGLEVVEAEQMPAVGANAFPIALADWRRAYLIVDRVGLSVLRDPYTAHPMIAFKTRKRVGGGIQNFDAIKLLRIAA